MGRLGILATVVLSGALAACGSDSTTTTFDAPVPDAPKPDAAPVVPDAPGPDAGPTLSGTLGIHDIQLLTATGDVNAAAGHGGKIDLTFSADATQVLSKSMPHTGGLAPCYAGYSVASTLPAQRNEGTVKFTVKKSDNSAGVAIPDCTFQADNAYHCSTAGAGGAIAAAAVNADKGFLTFTDAGASTVFGPENIGRYLIVAGGTNAGAAFPITGASGNKLGLVNVPAVAPFTLTAPYLIAAGVGPVPATTGVDGTITGLAPPFINDGDKVTVELVAGGMKDFASYTSATVTAGEHLALNAATKTLLSAPLDLSGTKALTFAVDATTSGAATGIIVVIDATDATTFKSDTDMGTAKLYSGSLTCSELGAGSVTIEKEILGVIGAMNPTKVRVAIFYDGFDATALTKKLNIVAGHGLIQFRKL